MRRVVETHEQFNGLGVTLSGKTGTAELDIYHPNHGLFIGYTTSASTGAPEYALAVRIANGYSSGNACLTANDILQYIYDLADEDTILTAMPPAIPAILQMINRHRASALCLRSQKKIPEVWNISLRRIQKHGRSDSNYIR